MQPKCTRVGGADIVMKSRPRYQKPEPGAPRLSTFAGIVEVMPSQRFYVNKFPTSQPGPLTPRQREVLQLLAEGHTMKEAAAILNVATRTVAFHKYRIMQDFSLANNSELLRFAIKQRVIEQR
jgi:DNA-binding NarL/FixJ family response regulator